MILNDLTSRESPDLIWPQMTLNFRAFLLRVADQSIEEIKQKRAARGRRWVWPTIFILLALSIFIIRKLNKLST